MLLAGIANFGLRLPHAPHPVWRLARCALLCLAFALPGIARALGEAADFPGPATLPFMSFLDLLAGQVVVIGQHSFPFRSPYEGPNSLPGSGETRTSDSYLLGIGKQLGPYVQGFVNLRVLRGDGLGHENGLGGYANGDFTAAAADSNAYVLRAFAKVTMPLAAQPEEVAKGAYQIPGEQPAERIEMKLGRFLPTDDFDQLRYASSPATQFINLGLVNNPAWDNAQTGRGYTDGAYVGIIRDRWELRAGLYRMPKTANGPVLDTWTVSRSNNLELTLKPAGDDGIVVRGLFFRNTARMGNYRNAVNRSLLSGEPPDVFADEQAGRTKRGATFNVELPLADDGDTGFFACAGWNDGRNEDFSFTEVDRNVCAGMQVSGRQWGRAKDAFGIAALVNGLSTPHRDYLAAGGSGFQLGDGTLNYGRERIFETYYRYQATRYLQLSPDLQYIVNPGFNRDRGPAKIIGLRVRLAF